MKKNVRNVIFLLIFLSISVCVLYRVCKKSCSYATGDDIRIVQGSNSFKIYINNKKTIDMGFAANVFDIGVNSNGADLLYMQFDRKNFTPVIMRRYVHKDGGSWIYEYGPDGEVAGRHKLLDTWPEEWGE